MVFKGLINNETIIFYMDVPVRNTQLWRTQKRTSCHLCLY